MTDEEILNHAKELKLKQREAALATAAKRTPEERSRTMKRALRKKRNRLS